MAKGLGAGVDPREMKEIHCFRCSLCGHAFGMLSGRFGLSKVRCHS